MGRGKRLSHRWGEWVPARKADMSANPWMRENKKLKEEIERLRTLLSAFVEADKHYCGGDNHFWKELQAARDELRSKT